MTLSRRQCNYLHHMGIDVWVDRSMPGSRFETAQTAASALNHSGEWQLLQTQVRGCTKCALSETRTQTVFGVGDPNADWLLIGEAPGAEEDRQGEPFVGRAGKLLDSMLLAMGKQRRQVFIANILKCRPPSNRDPRAEEAAACEAYLQKQIALIKPAIILAMGRIAAQNLLKTDTPIGKMRGQLYYYSEPGIPVVVTYHPAYLLRSPREKRKVWADLKRAMDVYERQK